MKCDLAYIKVNFSYIIANIKKLETSNLALVNLLNVLKQVENFTNNLPTYANSTTKY